MKPAAPIEGLRAAAYTIPTDSPEADGTIEWDATTLVTVHAFAAGHAGLGYSYTHVAAVPLIEGVLAAAVAGLDATAIPQAWAAMRRALRNIGRPGLAACAVSAVDNALWDLKARLHGEPLARLLGMVRPDLPLYGSGGFTTYPVERLQAQLAGWAQEDLPAVKMKVGAQPQADLARVRAARAAIGDGVALFVDANGAYGRKQALGFAEAFAAHGVRWFEEPVSSDDREGLRLLRDRAPAGMDIAAGEYGYDDAHFRGLLDSGAVDVLQADATRCCGITGLLRAGVLADAYHTALSSHCAPAQHLHACCALPRAAPMEWFHDHVRIERMLFEGFVEPVHGRLAPDLSRPGIGLQLREADARRYAVA
jgi:L-alanine-DL-glutamate epimerase-like enolase superfamily enzyme